MVDVQRGVCSALLAARLIPDKGIRQVHGAGATISGAVPTCAGGAAVVSRRHCEWAAAETRCGRASGDRCCRYAVAIPACILNPKQASFSEGSTGDARLSRSSLDGQR